MHKTWESVGVLQGQQIADQFKPKAAVYHIDGDGPAVAAEKHELERVGMAESKSKLRCLKFAAARPNV